MDVTRNDSGEVLLSIVLPKGTSLVCPVITFGQAGDRWVANISEQGKAERIILPYVHDTAVEWISSVPRHSEALTKGRTPIPGDPRKFGTHYLLVCEVVNDTPIGSYFARIKDKPYTEELVLDQAS
ncbi:hypothetical protein TH5_00250 [Thalassospira xianhensis MCCC 1A02616]|nr:hypothetical protein TH5_00250 [Thalassospira xianhensis MCCC 1A02616]